MKSCFRRSEITAIRRTFRNGVLCQNSAKAESFPYNMLHITCYADRDLSCLWRIDTVAVKRRDLRNALLGPKRWSELARTEKNIRFRYEVLVVKDELNIARWSASFVRVPPGLQTKLDGIFVISLDDEGRCKSLQGVVAQAAELTAGATTSCLSTRFRGRIALHLREGLFESQSDHGVEARRPPRGNVGRRDGHNNQQHWRHQQR